MSKLNILFLIGLAIMINFGLSFFHVVSSVDSICYFIIAKNMVLNGDWFSLMTGQGPWLDKPHFPFWVTAISFKLFGFHFWSYIFPGFIFYIIGAIYTYKIARLFYSDEIAALFSMLIYLTIFGLITSSIVVKAEIYLLGEIIPACYYWLSYNEKAKLKYLFFGALFTACALMTKGLFVLVTIGSGLICLWIYQKQYKNFIAVKWLLALFLSFLFALPEFIALYLQFHFEGLQWFFVGSQFGRFFNTGRIAQGNGHHIYYFIMPFLGAFLPWTLTFIFAMHDSFKNFGFMSAQNKKAFIYLSSSFFITFFMFSVSGFQLDHYISIIFPFAAILSAHYLSTLMNNVKAHFVFRVQFILSIILLILVTIIWLLIFLRRDPHFLPFLFIPASALIFIGFFNKKNNLSIIKKGIIYSVISVNVVFLFYTVIEREMLIKFQGVYNIANYLNNQKSQLPVYEYKNDPGLSVYMKNGCSKFINNIDEFPINSKYYVVVGNPEVLPELMKKFPKNKIILQQQYLKVRVLRSHILLSTAQLNALSTPVTLLEIN